MSEPSVLARETACSQASSATESGGGTSGEWRDSVPASAGRAILGRTEAPASVLQLVPVAACVTGWFHVSRAGTLVGASPAPLCPGARADSAGAPARNSLLPPVLVPLGYCARREVRWLCLPQGRGHSSPQLWPEDSCSDLAWGKGVLETPFHTFLFLRTLGRPRLGSEPPPPAGGRAINPRASSGTLASPDSGTGWEGPVYDRPYSCLSCDHSLSAGRELPAWSCLALQVTAPTLPLGPHV